MVLSANKRMVSSTALAKILLVILLLGIFLRIYNLDSESLWNDEAFSVRIAQQPTVRQVISSVAETEAAPPGYYVLLHYWTMMVGNSVFMLRLLSAIFSALSILIFFLLVRRLLNSPLALLASLFMATSMLQIEYAQEARLYALFTFLSLSTVYFFARWSGEISPPGDTKSGDIRSENKKPALFWYALCALAALYVNYLAVFVIAGSTIVLVSRKEPGFWKKWWKPWLSVHLIIFLLGLPLLPFLLGQFQTLNTGLAEVLVQKGVPSLLAQLGLFLFGLPAVAFTLLLALIVSKKSIKPVLLTVDRYFFPAVFIIGLAYLYVSLKPLVWGGIPLIRVPITNSYFLIRHSFFLVPLWYIYLGYKVDGYYFRSNKKYVAALIVALVLFFSFFSLHQYYRQPTKAQWQEAIQFIAEDTIAEDTSVPSKTVVLLDKGGTSNTFLFHYYAPEDWLLLRLTWAERWRDFQQVDEDRLFQLLDKTEGFWLVLSRNTKTGYYYRDLLDQQYNREASQQFYQLEVFKYEKFK